LRITDVKTVLLTGPCSNDPFINEICERRSAAFIEVHTSLGVVGVGETYAGYFCAELVPAIVEFFKPVLIGQSVDDVPELWRRMYHCGNYWCRVGLGTAVLTGIEAALWDLKGKLEEMPVYELLGGLKHDTLPCYATGGPSNYPKDQLVAKVDFYLSLGFRAVKVGTGSHTPEGSFFQPVEPAEAADYEADKLSFLRSRFGSDLGIMLDGHMGNSLKYPWTLATAKAVARALEPFDLFFLEEPLHYTDPWGYAELCASTTVPIAGGECLTGVYEWRVFTEQDCFDIGQPDASFTGGLGEVLNVASMLQDRGRKIATHAAGAGGSFMQNLHCGFACENTVILETLPAYADLHTEIIDGSFRMVDGSALPPDRPGLGIVLTDEIKNRYPFVPGSGEFSSVPGKEWTGRPLTPASRS
jgi:L-alanine-DL-glutamate epimerase-like enolase superfamily enzyme